MSKAVEFLRSAAEAVKERFPEEPVYADRIRQGFKAPCFFVDVAEERLALMGTRQKRRFTVTVRRLSAQTERAVLEGWEAAEGVCGALMELTPGQGLPVRAQELTTSIGGDDWLTVTARYEVYVAYIENTDKMRELSLQGAQTLEI